MEPDLVRRTPFGLAMVRLPEHMRDSLLDHGIFPTQTEGELFMQLCMQQVPPDHPEAMDGEPGPLGYTPAMTSTL